MGRIAGGNSAIEDEYAGTGSDDIGIENGSGNTAIEPTDVDGSGSGGNFGNDGTEFDPAIHVGPTKRNADGSYTRKRGRKAGGNSNARPTGKAQTNLGGSVDSLSKALLIVHTGLAATLKLPELVLDKSESDMLAQSAANVLAQFDIAPDPKVQAIIGAIMACGVVYGPRVALYQMRKAQEKREAKGAAGLYDAAGNPIGTTEFSSN